MKTSNRPTENPADESARRSAVRAFVDALKQRAREVPAETALPEQLEVVSRQVERDDDLAARFTQMATSIGANVHLATTADWLDVVGGLLRARQAGNVAIPRIGDGFCGVEQVGQLKQRLAADGVATTCETDDATFFSVDAAVTGVVAAIAETGSLVCESQPLLARGSSLIPPVHVAVVASSQLLPDVHDYFTELSQRAVLPANVTLIGGPSKTADIEGVLVTGVHGPRELHVVLVREE